MGVIRAERTLMWLPFLDSTIFQERRKPWKMKKCISYSRGCRSLTKVFMNVLAHHFTHLKKAKIFLQNGTTNPKNITFYVLGKKCVKSPRSSRKEKEEGIRAIWSDPPSAFHLHHHHQAKRIYISFYRLHNLCTLNEKKYAHTNYPHARKSSSIVVYTPTDTRAQTNKKRVYDYHHPQGGAGPTAGCLPSLIRRHSGLLFCFFVFPKESSSYLISEREMLGFLRHFRGISGKSSPVFQATIHCCFQHCH